MDFIIEGRASFDEEVHEIKLYWLNLSIVDDRSRNFLSKHVFKILASSLELPLVVRSETHKLSTGDVQEVKMGKH